MAPLKRFWRTTGIAADGDGWAILLDERPLRTPARAVLRVPTDALAQAVAAEWDAVADEVRPDALALTGLANAATDIVAPDRAAFALSLARYAESDLTCYRADRPAGLVARQAALWEPPLKAVEAGHDLLFRRATGVQPVDQPAETLARVRQLLGNLPDATLAALQPMVTISGSVVLALAHHDGVLGWEACFDAGMLDEDWQAEQWGADAEAQAVRARRKAAFEAAARFLALSRG